MAIAVQPRPTIAHAASAAAERSMVWHAYTVIFAAACVMIGVYWDISWHMSIGRDTFWTPAHLLIQAGGLIAGLSSGYVALHTTFRGTKSDRDASVNVWGFRAPLGAWTCIWGCAAMLTSAPFDNWWHNAYGLDVKIISPPHALLAIGIFSIVVGALLLTLAQQNRAEDEHRRRRLAVLLALTGGFFLMNFALFLTEYSERDMMHGALYYEVTAIAFPLALATLSRAIKLRWAATSAAAFFTAIMLGLMWFIQLFPATPKLGPIYQPITHMVTLAFPPLVIVPAFCIDLLMQRFDGKLGTSALACIIGPVFVLAFLAAQWPFATFLVESPLARNWFFNAENWVFWMTPTYAEHTRHFPTPDPNAWPFAAHVLIAIVIAIVMSSLGLRRGRWMTQVRR